MPRSVKLRADVIGKVQTIVHNNFYCQNDLADELGFAQSTISNFINGKPVDRRKFQDICEKLGITDWRSLAENPQQDQSVNIDELPKTPDPTPSLPTQSEILLPSHEYRLEAPEGAVPLRSVFYVERLPQETYCQEEISRPHAMIRLKAPRQMGKTSIIVRLLHQAEQQGDRVVYLSLEQIMEQAWSNADRLLAWFCASVSLKTQHKFQAEEYASLVAMVGSTLGTQEYFESYLLPDLAAPLTISLDSVDRLFEYPHLYNNFFSLLRSLHEAGKHTAILSKLRLVISHAAEVYIPLDINQSPFNVGVSVAVSEFTPDQVALLATKHQLNWTTNEIGSLMGLIGGHPFLIRLAMFEVASNKIDLPNLIASAASRKGIFYQQHLARLESALSNQPDLLTAMANILRTREDAVLSLRLKGQLEGLGLVKLQGELIVPRCELYRRYFTNLLLI
jgi:transcriptional regulator with XRE-family HTH domain